MQCMLESVEKALPQAWQNKQTEAEKDSVAVGGGSWQIPERTTFFIDFSEINNVWLEAVSFKSSSQHFKTWNEEKKLCNRGTLDCWAVKRKDVHLESEGTWDTLTFPPGCTCLSYSVNRQKYSLQIYHFDFVRRHIEL